MRNKAVLGWAMCKCMLYIISAQLDKSIHPVVLYEYYLNCIFMKMHDKIKKMRENHVKTINPREVVRWVFFMPPKGTLGGI